MGAMGGLVGAGQLIGTGARTSSPGARTTRSNDFFTQHLPRELTGLASPAGFPEGALRCADGAAALAVVAAGFGVARLVREI